MSIVGLYSERGKHYISCDKQIAVFRAVADYTGYPLAAHFKGFGMTFKVVCFNKPFTCYYFPSHRKTLLDNRNFSYRTVRIYFNRLHLLGSEIQFKILAYRLEIHGGGRGNAGGFNKSYNQT